MTRALQAEEERDDMERVKLDNKRILFNLLPAHVAQHFLMSNPRNMVSVRDSCWVTGLPGVQLECQLSMAHSASSATGGLCDLQKSLI